MAAEVLRIAGKQALVSPKEVKRHMGYMAGRITAC